MFTAAVFTIAKLLKQQEKKRNPAVCNNVDEFVGHYTKWNKPGTDRQILHDRTYV